MTLDNLEGGRRPTLVNEAAVDAETLRLGAEGLRWYFTRFGVAEEKNFVSRYRFNLTGVRSYGGTKTFSWRTEPLYGRVAEQGTYGRTFWSYRKPEKRVVDVIPENPEWVYRGMSWGEWKNIRKTGFILSRGDYNIGDEQKGTTLFGDSVTARAYASSFAPIAFKPSRRHPGVVIAIPKNLTYQPAYAQGSGEFSVRGALPMSHIQAVWFLVATEVTSGVFELVHSEWKSDRAWSEGSRYGTDVRYTVMQAYPEEML